MIVLDIETSGLYPEKHGIWQIGALDFYDPENTFLEEARIDDEDEISQDALEVTRKTEEYLRDDIKISQRELISRFFEWTNSCSIKSFICQNPQFDADFINFKARKYNLKSPVHHTAFDLHTAASLKCYDVNGNFLIKEGHSDMGLANILKFCGMADNREAHNALEDARLTAECFSRILDGKSLFKAYKGYKIPRDLLTT